MELNKDVKEHGSVSFPPVYEKVSSLSKLYKRRYYTITKLMVLLLVTVPILLFFTTFFLSIGYIYSGQAFGIASVVLLTFSLILEIIISNYNFAKKWQICRSVSETIKRENWFFWMGTDSYPTTDHNLSIHRLIEAERELIMKLTNNNIIIEVSKNNEFVPEDSEKWRELDFIQKWNIYRSKRQQDQIDWYAGQASLNRELRKKYFTISVVLMVLSFASAIVVIFLLGQYIEVTDVLIASTLATKTYTTAKQFDYLEFTYANTSLSLATLRDSTNHMDEVNKKNLLELVNNVENTISREHEVWIIKTLLK